MFSTVFSRVAAPGRGSLAAAAATLVFIAAFIAGCRDGQGPLDGAVPPQGLRLAAGEMFRYTRWDLDPNGYIDQSSRKSVLWRVISTGATLHGRSGVAVVADSIVGWPLRADSLLLYTGEDGALYVYGYLARVMLRKTDKKIPPAWDKIVAFGEAVNRSWTVGTSDSAGVEKVFGIMTGETRYFNATVSGISQVFQGRRVYLSGTEVSVELWISDQPSALAEIVEEPTYPSAYGVLYEITEVFGVVP